MSIRKTMLAGGIAAVAMFCAIPAQASPLAGKTFAAAERDGAVDIVTLVQAPPLGQFGAPGRAPPPRFNAPPPQVNALTPQQLRARNARRAQTNALGIAVGVGALAVGAAAAAGAFDPSLPPPPPPRRRVVVEEEEPVFVERRRRVVVEEPEVVYRRPARRMSEADAYCAQRFRSYDPRTGTYVGFDGVERACP